MEPESDAADPLNQMVLENLRRLQDDDDPNFLTDLILTFIEESARQMELLQIAVTENDREALRSMSHGLKSSSASIGADVVSRLCRDLEAMGQNGTMTKAMETMQQIRLEHQRAKKALLKFIEANLE